MLAVGKPSSVPPRRSPVTTGPRTWWGRPSRTAAPSTSPAATSVRILVDETGTASGPPASSDDRDTPSTANPATDPLSVSSATLPLRPWPKWKSSPTTTNRASRPPTSSRATNSSAVSFARSSSKRTTTVRSTPADASSSSFWSRSHSNSGADAGRTTEAVGHDLHDGQGYRRVSAHRTPGTRGVGGATTGSAQPADSMTTAGLIRSVSVAS